VTESEPTDPAIRALLDAGDVDGAAALAITSYGPEIYGYLCAIAGDDALAADALAIASERIWHGLPSFRWEAAVRTWAYRLARHALATLQSHGSRRRERNLPLSLASNVEAACRSSTAPFRRTDTKAALLALRDALDPADRELLILRLDRRMAWKEIASLLAAADDDQATLTQRAAALRKRFERVKDQLRAVALDSGLISE